MSARARKRKITGTGGKDKTTVLGMIERGGEVRAEVVPNVGRGTLQRRVRETVEPAALIRSERARGFLQTSSDRRPTLAPRLRWER